MGLSEQRKIYTLRVKVSVIDMHSCARTHAWYLGCEWVGVRDMWLLLNTSINMLFYINTCAL